MAGNPLHRARYKGRELQPVVPLRIPQVEWNRMSEVEKIKAAFGLNLDDVHALVSIPWEQADPHDRVLKIRLFETLMRTGLQLLDRRERDDFRDRVLANLGVLIGQHRDESGGG